MVHFAISYEVLCEVLFDKDSSIEEFLKINYPLLSREHHLAIVAKVMKNFMPNFNKRYNTISRNKAKFFKKYSDWVKRTFQFNIDDQQVQNKGGRPDKPFGECGKRAQNYKIKKIRETHSQVLIDAASSCDGPKTTSFDINTALALITQAKLSKFQYEILRQAAKHIGHDIYPSYKKVMEAKQKCYPENIIISESSAKVPLQDLLDHTAKRIIECKNGYDIPPERDLLLHTKWGCDGASGQNEYMQKFEEPEHSDANLFMCSIVPLQMNLIIKQGEDQVVWKNPHPSSTRYCRPIKFEYVKETPQIIRQEKSQIENEIETLKPTQIALNGKTIKIYHDLYFTMIDGKVAQVVTNTSSSSNCVICGAKPSEMNNLPALLNKQCNEVAFSLGMSTLHARIRFMEFILHLGYNLPFRSWRVTNATRPIKELTKKQIQRQFKERLGIQVDVVKQGTGNTNSGNTSRRFFSDPSITAEITGIDKNLIQRLAVILEVICSSYPIDINKFGVYARETAELAVSLYPWYSMPATVHKILIHGKEIIQHAVLPIGILSEEAQEHRNKDYKYYRSHHSRKISRIATNEDVFHNMMISSDPYITSLRPETKAKHLPLSEEAKKLLE